VNAFFNPIIVLIRNDNFSKLEPWLVHEEALPHPSPKLEIATQPVKGFYLSPVIAEDLLGTTVNTSF